ncbi:hypothetical protein [Halorhodospira sp. 9622]|uniref:hypothetical protein n=1 Tax=Halorhodospira sp. 9622 TaxID=2899136 RepID=UPI001EE78635|nr:hypothetical protein [Halorhodospira sp. 9622]
MSINTGPDNRLPLQRPVAAALPLLLYPLWSHAMISAGLESASLLGLAVLAALTLYLRGGPTPGSLAAVALLFGAALADLLLAHPVALYAPPILLPMAVAWMFGRTLLAGRQPLVEQIATAIVGDRHSSAERRYMRTVTWLWTLLCSALTLNTILLLLLGASPQTWSLFANIINYLVIGGAMIGEYLVRCLRFGWPEDPLAFWRAVARIDWRRLS